MTEEPEKSGAESSMVSARMAYAQVLREPRGVCVAGVRGHSERPLEGTVLPLGRWIAIS